MSRLLRTGVLAALAAATLVPASAQAWTCRPYGVQPESYTVAGHTVDAYGVEWVC